MQATFIKSLVCAAIAAVTLTAQAAPVLSTGTVTTINRSMTFNALNASFIDLNAYEEDEMYATIDDFTYVGFGAFAGYDNRGTGFHYGSGGNNSYVSIRGTDNAVLSAIDFVLGNGFGNSKTTLRFETFLNGEFSGSFFQAGLLNGVYKISDAAGFDEIRLGGNVAATYGSFNDFQAIALDDVHVQLKTGDVPEPAGLALFGLALAGLAAARRKKAA